MQKIKEVAQKLSPSSMNGSANGAEAPHAAQGGNTACAPCAATTTPLAGGAVVQQTTTTVAAVPVVQQASCAPAAADVAVARPGEAAVCSAEYFTKVEDRPVVKERVELIQEHVPVAKEFVVETRATGVEREVAEGRYSEVIGVTERVVAVTPPKPPCA